MEKRNLLWLDSYTIEEFKKLNNVEKIQIGRYRKSGKLYFKYGTHRGVACNGMEDLNVPRIISKVQGESTPYNPDGQFFMMHRLSEGSPDIIAEI